MSNHTRNDDEMAWWRHPRARWLAAALLVFATIGAYSNSLNGAFVFDDLDSIVENYSLRSFATALVPPKHAGVAGRPLLNLSFAANYAVGQLSPRGYHIVNLAIHLGAALVVLGLVRRTLERPRLAEKIRSHALPIAGVIALLWALHPLQTESVTYVSQRSEALAGGCLLLALFGFVRSLDSSRPACWLAGSVAASLVGMSIKETMIVAPLIVLLYDRFFVAETWREIWRTRWRYYAGLGATWLWLGWLLIKSEILRRGVGSGEDVSMGRYAAVECGAILHYLRLVFWPVGLILDYGVSAAEAQFSRLGYAVGLAGLGVIVGLAGRRWPALGFLAIWLAVSLAPTSTVVPIIGQPVAEHRMYLALLGPVVAVVTVAFHWCGQRALAALAIAALLAGGATWCRNRDYRTADSIWADTLAKNPKNERAWDNLGMVRFTQGRMEEARSSFEAGLRLQPRAGMTHLHLGTLLAVRGNIDQALMSFTKAVELMPANPNARNSLAGALVSVGRLEEALPHLVAILQLNPENASVHANLGGVLRQLGRFDEAIARGQEAVRLMPRHPGAHGNLAMALLDAGRIDEAVSHHREWLRLQPGYTGINYEFSLALLRANRMPEAQAELEDMLRRHPDDAQTHNLLGVVFVNLKQRGAAQREFERALQLQPDLQLAKDNLASLSAPPPDAVPASGRPGP